MKFDRWERLADISQSGNLKLVERNEISVFNLTLPGVRLAFQLECRFDLLMSFEVTSFGLNTPGSQKLSVKSSHYV
jgi:hypothetical protein